jgi:phosphoribosylanthranilate isomerase
MFWSVAGRNLSPSITRIMSVRVKICGITNLDDARAAIAAGADALGFVFVPGTPRYVSPDLAGEIVRELPPFIARVGLFVDAETRTVAEVLVRSGMDTLQFHGEETPDFVRQFRRAVKVMKAFRVRGEETLMRLPAYADAVDAVLLDAYVAGAHGGTGAQFDWNLAVRARDLGKPLVLAGGLTPTNVAEAVRTVRPYGVDVSSGVESAPGQKDPEKLAAFVRAAKSA